MSKPMYIKNNFDPNNIVFGEIEGRTVTNSKVTYGMIPVSYQYENGIGPLYIVSPNDMFSWGVKMSQFADSAANKYSFGVCGFADYENPRQDELDFVDILKGITDACYNHVVENKVEIQKKAGVYIKENVTDSRFTQIVKYPAKPKKEEYANVPNFSFKFMTDKNGLMRGVTDADTGAIVRDPMQILDQRCHARLVLRVWSIYVGTKVSVQVKIHELKFKLQSTNQVSILADVDEE